MAGLVLPPVAYKRKDLLTGQVSTVLFSENADVEIPKSNNDAFWLVNGWNATDLRYKYWI